jgi:hypothetical protein
MAHTPRTSPDSDGDRTSRRRPPLRALALRAVLGAACAVTVGLFLILMTHWLTIHRLTIR